VGTYYDPVYCELKATKRIMISELDSLQYLCICGFDSEGFLEIDYNECRWSDSIFKDLKKLIELGVRGEWAIQLEGEHCLYVLTEEGVKCYGGDVVYDREKDLFEGRGRPLTYEEWEERQKKVQQK